MFDTQGRNLQDPARWNKTSDLNRPGDTHLIPGMVVPIRPDHRGEVEIEFKADDGSGMQSVYKKRLDYDGKSDRDAPGQPAPEP